MKPLIGRVWIFIVMCIAGGLGAAVGSVVGHSFGSRGLFIGAVVGGLLAVSLVARFAAWRGWIAQSQWRMTTLGGMIGFLLAAFIVTLTVSCRVGTILGSLVI